ncbi:MAG TPA: hypothetical protein VLF40_02755 [Candidatus Saccharimonadales bacterium]|nr:hypothetical protein [Candidatus Saccharimonadales bacterium]
MGLKTPPTREILYGGDDHDPDAEALVAETEAYLAGHASPDSKGGGLLPGEQGVRGYAMHDVGRTALRGELTPGARDAHTDHGMPTKSMAHRLGMATLRNQTPGRWVNNPPYN